MAGFSDTIATEILNYFLRGTAMTTFSSNASPASVWVALYNGDPTGAGTELTYTNYARVAVSRGSGSWDAPSGTDPTPSAASEEGGVYWSTFVPAVAGEHVVKTEAVKDGRVFRHRQVVEVQPW
jgi:hypothetical protein